MFMYVQFTTDLLALIKSVMNGQTKKRMRRNRAYDPELHDIDWSQIIPMTLVAIDC